MTVITAGMVTTQCARRRKRPTDALVGSVLQLVTLCRTSGPVCGGYAEGATISYELNW